MNRLFCSLQPFDMVQQIYAVDNNGNKVTLKEDNLEKEITPCNPINWKIKL